MEDGGWGVGTWDHTGGGWGIVETEIIVPRGTEGEAWPFLLPAIGTLYMGLAGSAQESRVSRSKRIRGGGPSGQNPGALSHLSLLQLISTPGSTRATPPPASSVTVTQPILKAQWPEVRVEEGPGIWWPASPDVQGAKHSASPSCAPESSPWR